LIPPPASTDSFSNESQNLFSATLFAVEMEHAAMWIARVSVGAETMFFISFFFLISGLSRWVCCYFELDVRVIFDAPAVIIFKNIFYLKIY
jgi:hypothetical protein